MLSNRVTETVTAALKGENKAPTSVRGWQERSRLVGEGVREERGGDTVQGKPEQGGERGRHGAGASQNSGSRELQAAAR